MRSTIRKGATIFLAVGLFAAGFAGAAQAASHSGGGGHFSGNSHGGHFGAGGHFGGRGGRHWGGGFYGGYGVGLGVGLGALYYGGYPYGAGYDAYDYPDTYDGDYSDSSSPYSDPDSSQSYASGTGAPGAYWYHCDSPEGYYPYVQTCRHNWQPVPAAPPPPQTGD